MIMSSDTLYHQQLNTRADDCIDNISIVPTIVSYINNDNTSYPYLQKLTRNAFEFMRRNIHLPTTHNRRHKVRKDMILYSR